MKSLIILAHPARGSFNHALTETVAARFRHHGWETIVHDLYAEKFDPVTPASELPKDAVLPPDIEAYCREAETADVLVLVHPNWWSQPPAILKGWVDRILRPGRAYQFVRMENGEGRAEGLLRAQAALVINTANTPQDKELALLGDPQAVFWERVVFGLCGLRDVRRLIFSPVIISTLAERQAWLRAAEGAADAVCAAVR